jgi:hypothetical protein
MGWRPASTGGCAETATPRRDSGAPWQIGRGAGAYKRADYFARNVRTIKVAIDRESILTGAAAGGVPWKYSDLGDGYCTDDFFAKMPPPARLRPLSLLPPKNSTKGLLLAVKGRHRADARTT